MRAVELLFRGVGVQGQGERQERRLGAIMFTDVVGSSSITSENEDRGLRLLKEHAELLQSVFPKYRGRVVKTMGDGFLVEFASAVEAVNCAVEVQRELERANSTKSPDNRVIIKIGIHVGDVVHSEGDVMGDAVNVAARVQPLAEPGGICVTRQVVDQVERKVDHQMIRIGARDLKNIHYPVELYKVVETSRMSRFEVDQGLDPRRVAILPFANLSPDPNDRYFADGLTEEMISTVSKIRELTVISRTSVMRYRDSVVPISQIGQDLAVGSVLEGSVRKAGNKVRITAQLIEVQGDRHLWSQNYDRDLTDVFAIQGDIAEQVAGVLKVQLLSGERQLIRKKATANPEAYTLYLKGRYYWNERTEEGVKKALRYFEEAAKVDPEFAMAYSGIADSYNILSDYAWLPPAEAGPLAKANAVRALELDDSLAEAHASLGLTMSAYSWDFASAERELRRAIELKPNYAPAYHWYSVLLYQSGRHEEATDEEKQALMLDPYSRIYNMASANDLLTYGKVNEAIEKYDELVNTYPDFGAVLLWKSGAHALLAQFDKAIEAAKKFVEVDNGSWNSKLNLAWVYATAGNHEEAEKILGEAMATKEKTYVSSCLIGWAKLVLGQKDEGYRWLQKAYEERDPSLLYFNGFPWTQEFRSDPRWVEIEGKIGFSKP